MGPPADQSEFELRRTKGNEVQTLGKQDVGGRVLVQIGIGIGIGIAVVEDKTMPETRKSNTLRRVTVTGSTAVFGGWRDRAKRTLLRKHEPISPLLSPLILPPCFLLLPPPPPPRPRHTPTGWTILKASLDVARHGTHQTFAHYARSICPFLRFHRRYQCPPSPARPARQAPTHWRRPRHHQRSPGPQSCRD
jgi:hypothetical protein